MIKNIDNTVNLIIKDPKKISIDSYQSVYIDTKNENDCFFEDENVLSYTLGYIRDYSLKADSEIARHNQSGSHAIQTKIGL